MEEEQKRDYWPRSLAEGAKERTAQTRVQVFKGSINEIQDLINDWAEQEQATIRNTSLCYDENSLGKVFVIVVYELRSP